MCAKPENYACNCSRPAPSVAALVLPMQYRRLLRPLCFLSAISEVSRHVCTLPADAQWSCRPSTVARLLPRDLPSWHVQRIDLATLSCPQSGCPQLVRLPPTPKPRYQMTLPSPVWLSDAALGTTPSPLLGPAPHHRLAWHHITDQHSSALSHYSPLTPRHSELVVGGNCHGVDRASMASESAALRTYCQAPPQPHPLCPPQSLRLSIPNSHCATALQFRRGPHIVLRACLHQPCQTYA